MKRWLAALAASVALVALWALPPAALEVPPRDTLPEVVRLREVELEIARAHAALRALRWSDSLSALLVGSAPYGVVLSPPTSQNLDAAVVRGWMDTQRALVDGLPRRDARTRVGAFWVLRDHGTVPGVPLMGRLEELTFVGERDGVPYCFRALPHTERIAFMSSPSSGLAACRLFAEYGMPGGPIREWLEASALGFGRMPVASFASDYASTALAQMEPAARIFGLSRPRLVDESLTVQACVAGRAAACERAVADLELIAPTAPGAAWLVAETPVSGVDSYVPQRPFGYLDDALLYEWEARWGSDAFARFWTSSEPVPIAFEAAFGEPLGAWVRDWVGEHVGLYRAGPSLPWTSVWTSVLALAALAVVATLAGCRRRAEGA